MFGLRFCDPHHFTYLDHDLGQGQTASLLRRHFRFYGQAEGVDEREQPFVVRRNEIARQAGNCNRVVFHERSAEDRRRQ